MQIQNNNNILLDKVIFIIENGRKRVFENLSKIFTLKDCRKFYGKSQSLTVFLNLLSIITFIDNIKLQLLTRKIKIANKI